MRLEIWSDVVCPWCYIGKRRLEAALAGFEHRDRVEIHWRSFLLDPSAPARAEAAPRLSVAEHLGMKYGGGAAGGRQMIAQVEAVAAEEGLAFRLGDAIRVGTVDAHRLIHLAESEGGLPTQGAVKEALLAAYFLHAEDVGDPAVLTRIGSEHGLDGSRVAAMLASEEYADDVEPDLQRAADLGVGGVPFFVVDGRYAVSGAQPADTFAQLLDRAWAESHPTLDLVGGPDAGVCGPDGCAI